jgi:mono/diheme cytochrome c family protein
MKSPLSRSAARSVATMLVALGATFAGADTPTPINLPASPAVNVTSGADVYNHICQGCHMPEGAGAVGAGHYPKLAGDPALASWEYVATTVLHGRNGMPSFGVRTNGEEVFGAATLSDKEVAEVVNYVRSHFGNKFKDKVTISQIASLPHPGTQLNPASTVTH